MYCAGTMCADQTQMYAIETVFFNQTDGVLINQFCINFETIVQQFLPQIEAILPFTIPNWLILLILPQLNVMHMSWMEIMSSSNPLSSDSIAYITNFVNVFPDSNIGSSNSWLDMFYPYLNNKGNLLYNMKYLDQPTQDPTICY